MECIFCKIANKELNTTFIYEDENIVAFDDIHPRAPIHKLIIPKQHIATLNDFTPQHATLISDLVFTAQKLAQDLKISADGYRLVFNCNKNGGQEVFHIHLHLLGGRVMHWPPG